MLLIAGGAAYSIHSDHLNTPRLIVNQANQIVWRWDNTDPFGNNPANENPSGLGVFTNNLRFPGQFFDKETNTHYNYFRDYDPGVGRYIQGDPIGLEGGMNLYGYVGQNPISYVDPLGLQAVPAPVPIPLPPVFIPGTAENKAFVESFFRAARAIKNAICDEEADDREARCEKQRKREEGLCEAIAGSRYPGNPEQAIRICKTAAFQRYSQCLRGRPESEWQPLTGVDTPI
ncbi:MAG: RHS repeat domain-containing protein [Methylococcales bacterium]